MTTTANLSITEIDSAQAQKEVTANNAIVVLDGALGVKAITMTDADYTLGTTGVPAEWQNGVLIMSGTLTAARNVKTVTNKKVYGFVNETTGGFAVTLKTVSGTGIAVAAGKSAFLCCDGTNVIRLSADV